MTTAIFNQDDDLLNSLTDEQPMEEQEENATESEVLDLLHNLRDRYEDIRHVRSTCNEVQTLLALTNTTSWTEFMSTHQEALKAFWKDEKTTAKTYTGQAAAKRTRLAKQAESIKTELQKLIKQRADMTAMKDKLAAAIADAEQTIKDEPFLTWDDEAADRARRAKAALPSMQTKATQIGKEEPILKQRLTALVAQEKKVKGALSALEKAEGDLPTLNLPIIFPEDICQLANGFATNVLYRLEALEGQLDNALLTVERQRAYDPLSDTGGGVYTPPSERIDNLQLRIEALYEVIEQLENTYEVSASLYGGDPQYLPAWTEWAARLADVRQKRASAQMRNLQANMARIKEGRIYR